MRKTSDESSVYREDLLTAVQFCTTDPYGLSTPHVKSGIRPLDELVGDFPAGDVTIILGDSGAGKSALMRNMAIAAAGDQHVLYVPLQDGTVLAATQKMLQAMAGIRPESLAKGALSSGERIALLDAGEVVKKSQLSMFCIDCMQSEHLNDAIETEWGDDSGYDGLSEDDEGFVLVDSINLLSAGASLSESVRNLKDSVFGTRIAIVATVAGGPELLNDVCSAGLVIHVTAVPGADPFACELRALKSSHATELAKAKGSATVHFDEAFAVVSDERREW